MANNFSVFAEARKCIETLMDQAGRDGKQTVTIGKMDEKQAAAVAAVIAHTRSAAIRFKMREMGLEQTGDDIRNVELSRTQAYFSRAYEMARQEDGTTKVTFSVPTEQGMESSALNAIMARTGIDFSDFKRKFVDALPAEDMLLELDYLRRNIIHPSIRNQIRTVPMDGRDKNAYMMVVPDEAIAKHYARLWAKIAEAHQFVAKESVAYTSGSTDLSTLSAAGGVEADTGRKINIGTFAAVIIAKNVFNVVSGQERASGRAR